MIRRTATGADGFMIRYAAARDARLSYRARGLLVAILANSVNWRVDADWLAQQGREGRQAILPALRELQEYGYLHRWVVRGPDGKCRTEWHISDTAKVGPESGLGTPVDRTPVTQTSDDRPSVVEPSDDRTPGVETTAPRTTAPRTPENRPPSFGESLGGNPPPPTPSRARTAPEVEALVVVVRTALPRTTPPPGRSVLVREASRLAGLGWTPERLQAAVRGHDWTGARSGAVVTWLRDLEAPEDEPQAAQGRPEWCGECDGATRLVSDPETGAQPVRCPRCHPLAGVPTARRGADDAAAVLSLAEGVALLRAGRPRTAEAG